MRVILILVDGMRPDAIFENPAARKLAEKSAYTLGGRTVYPSVTLPCHMSLFHSVDPDRHGTTTNTHMPQVRPISGLFDALAQSRKKCAMFYDWEQLRDLGRPGSLARSVFYALGDYGSQKADDMLTDRAVECLKQENMDFLFLYLGAPDVFGHDHGWMSEPYMEGLESAWKNIGRVLDAVSEEDVVIVTADHGGHGRSHGTQMPEDMTIPFFITGSGVEAGKELAQMNIKDIAPTVLKLFHIDAPREWEGSALV
jgi:predicted AlkP superfamily pyrophosphatase or phosphodiesterase